MEETPPEQTLKDSVKAVSDLEIHGIDSAVVQFTKVDRYTGFTAEYAWKDGDLVMHFFLPPEASAPTSSPHHAPKKMWLKWWTETFAKCLDEAARKYFNADYPRLEARYTEELESWWFRAKGYSHVLDGDAFALQFLKELDRCVDQAQTTSGA